MGEEAFDADSLNIVKDRVRKVLFGHRGSPCRRHPAAADPRREWLQRLQDRGLIGIHVFKCKMSPTAGRRSMWSHGLLYPGELQRHFRHCDIFLYDGKPASSSDGRSCSRG